MKQDLLVLGEDKQWANNRIVELEQAILDLGPEFHDVFNQSSETWHDNAPFDALRDRQSVLAAELQQLKQVLRRSLPSIPPQKSGLVGIGSVVGIEDELGQVTRYKIAGDWTPRAGEKDDNGSVVISASSPLARQLVGRRIGQTYSFGKRTGKVVELKERVGHDK